MTTTTRRGFLGALLAAAAAPAIVRSEILMPIVVPSTQIILPKLEIFVGDTTGLSAGVYTASAWVKAAGGQWERISKTFDVAPNERRKIALELPHKDPLVYGLSLEPSAPNFGQPAVDMRVTDGAIRFDQWQTPYMPNERIGMSRHFDERRK